MNDSYERQTEEWWRWTAKRQAQAEKLLTLSNSPIAEITFRGRLLSETLRNTNTLDTNQVDLHDLLTPRQVVTGEEPETVTFEVPIAYDQLTNIADLQIGIDCTDDDDSDFGCVAWMVTCKRAPNGNCLLVWRTIFEPPGKHALQLWLTLKEPGRGDEDISGPRIPFIISNLCQISVSSDHFDPELGAIIHAKLLEPNANYQIDLVTTNREHLKRLEGNTSNGLIKLHWDLKSDRGEKFTNDFFDSVFRITLSDSGRTQTMKGP